MDDSLRKLQLTQLEMLKLVDQICRENNICYSLYAGSLLGAIRHKGFIPWDDDLDICMNRDEYNRFLGLWDNSSHDGYILQNKENTPSFTQSFTKIRKEHTLFIQSEREAGLYHNGIFIDIFPVDRLPKNRFSRYLFYWYCLCYQLYTREFVPSQSGFFVQTVSRLLLAIVPTQRRSLVRGRLLRRITANGNDSSLQTIMIETKDSLRYHYPPDMMDHFVDLPFEDGFFMCCEDWDTQLTINFGDYRKLPPEEDRTWRHHPIELDFEHDYSEQLMET